jgi:hypothetical protein
MNRFTAGQSIDPIPENFLNYRDPNVRFAEEENEIFVTVTTSREYGMPAQDPQRPPRPPAVPAKGGNA